MRRSRRIVFAAWVAVVVLAGSLSGCGTLDEVRDKVDTVDQGTELLDDLDQNGTRIALADGLEALNALEAGYIARVELTGTSLSDFTLALRADGSGTVQAALVEADASGDYLVIGAGGDLPAGVYRISGDTVICATGTASALLSSDMVGIVDRLLGSAAGMGLLSVIDDAEEVKILDREATRYAVVDKTQDALDVLDQFENDGLADAVAQAGRFSLEGTLTLDDATGALVEAHSVYTPAEATNSVMFSVVVTQWGTVDPITLPDLAQISDACPDL